MDIPEPVRFEHPTHSQDNDRGFSAIFEAKRTVWSHVDRQQIDAEHPSNHASQGASCDTIEPRSVPDSDDTVVCLHSNTLAVQILTGKRIHPLRQER